MRDSTPCKVSPLVFFLLTIATAMAPAQQFQNVLLKGPNGGNPSTRSTIVQGLDGALYGTTERGGSKGCGDNGTQPNCGNIFKISQGKLTTVYNFCSQPGCPEGHGPIGGLVLGTDGNFYGTTGKGGRNCTLQSLCGTVFKITPKGKLTVLYSFCAQADCADGGGPIGHLFQADDGDFYGATSFGGYYGGDCILFGCGTIFRMTPSGHLTILATLIQPGPTGPVEGPDGAFYGTITSGGEGIGFDCPNGCGAVYKIDANGKFNVIYDFCSDFNCADGEFPGALTLGSDGKFYGFAETSFFSITPEGQITNLGGFPGPVGYAPSGPPLEAADGTFYGGTTFGGNQDCLNHGGCGTFFKVTGDGNFTVLHTFDQTDGFVVGPSAQSTMGQIFGSTAYGGIDDPRCDLRGCGSLFRLSTGLAPFVALVHNPATTGQNIGILGQGLKGSTNVSINGTPVAFTVLSNTAIRVAVPPGVSSGYVTVTTPKGTLTSNRPLVLLP